MLYRIRTKNHHFNSFYQRINYRVCYSQSTYGCEHISKPLRSRYVLCIDLYEQTAGGYTFHMSFTFHRWLYISQVVLHFTGGYTFHRWLYISQAVIHFTGGYTFHRSLLTQCILRIVIIKLIINHCESKPDLYAFVRLNRMVQ